MKTLLTLLFIIPSLSLGENWQYSGEIIFKNEKIITFYDKDSVQISSDNPDEVFFITKDLFINNQKLGDMFTYNNERKQVSINCRENTYTTFSNGIIEFWMNDNLVHQSDDFALPNTKKIKQGNFMAFLYRRVCN